VGGHIIKQTIQCFQSVRCNGSSGLLSDLSCFSLVVTAKALKLDKLVCCDSSCACSKSELFAVVKQPQGLEGPTHITLVTDNANHLVLHWGVSRAGEALQMCLFCSCS
jgi:hypothetical protein